MSESKFLLLDEEIEKEGEEEDQFGATFLSKDRMEYFYNNDVPQIMDFDKRGAIVPRILLIVLLSIFLISFGVSQYNISMSEVYSRECNDPLDECAGIPFEKTILPPFHDYLQDFTITKKYNLSFCLIPKVMSTIGTAALCYLDDSKKFTEAKRTIAREMYDSRFCVQNEMKSFEMVQDRMTKFENIIVVRDPIDRFISGFVEKCIQSDTDMCHGCGDDIRCFVRKEYRRLFRISQLFPVYHVADTHFAPQTWFCNMKQTLNTSTVIRYGSSGLERERMLAELTAVFRKSRVDENEIEMINSAFSRSHTSHSTFGSPIRAELEKLLREDQGMRKALIRMYYHDFRILGFKML